MLKRRGQHGCQEDVLLPGTKRRHLLFGFQGFEAEV